MGGASRYRTVQYSVTLCVLVASLIISSGLFSILFTVHQLSIPTVHRSLSLILSSLSSLSAIACPQRRDPC